MERLVAKSQTALDKVTAKAVKNGNAPTNDIVELQGANKVLSNEKKALESDIAAIEAQYANVAKAKLDRRLKSGADEKKVSTYEKQLETTSARKEACEEAFEAKITKLEDKKTALDDQIEILVEAYREKLKSKIKIQEIEIDNKIAALKTQKVVELKKFDITISHFQPLIDACYETQPQVEVVYPPSYYKKKEQLEKLTRQISTNEMLVNAMALDMVTRAQIPETQEEVIRRRLREQARRDDYEAKIIADEAQRQQEIRENLAKRAEYEREAEARKERKKANSQSKPVVIDIPIEDLKAFYAKHDAVYHSDESEEDNSSETSTKTIL
jgi:hypothetical protein